MRDIKSKLLKLYRSSLTTLILVLAISSWATTEVDFDIASGRKPLSPIVNYTSKFDFPLERSELKRYFSSFTDESPNPNNKVPLLRLRKNLEVHEFQDTDGNNFFDTWRHYLGGTLEFEAKLNENKKVIAQKTWFGSNESITEVWVDKTLSGTFDEIHIYQEGKIIKTLRDENKDGLPEIEIVYYVGDKQKGKDKLVSQLRRDPLPKREELIFAGIYSTEEEPQFDKELSQLIATKLNLYFSNDYTLSEAIATQLKKIAKKYPSRRLYHRFQIFHSVAEALSRKNYQGYVFTGNIYRSPARTTLQLRIIGPDAKSLFYSATLEYSSRDFTSEKATNDIDKIFKSLQH